MTPARKAPPAQKPPSIVVWWEGIETWKQLAFSFPVLAVLPGQLIPYWSGVGLGLNPDTQRSNVPKHARAWNMLFPPGTH